MKLAAELKFPRGCSRLDHYISVIFERLRPQIDGPAGCAILVRMSARKINGSDLFQPVTVHADSTRLDLPAAALTFRKNGIEFRTNDLIPTWTEMTVSLQTPGESRRFNCTGVVVACNGSRHTGYIVSMVFTNLSRQAQLRLHNLAYSPLA